MLLLLDVQRLDAFLRARALSLTEEALADIKSRLLETLKTPSLETTKAAAHLLCNALKTSATPARQNVCFHGIAALYGMRTWNTLRSELETTTSSSLRVEAQSPSYGRLTQQGQEFARFAFEVTLKPAGLARVPEALETLSSRVRPDSYLSILTCVTPDVASPLKPWRVPLKATSPELKVLSALSKSRKAHIEDLARNGYSSFESLVAPRALRHLIIFDMPILTARDEERLEQIQREAKELIEAEFDWKLKTAPIEHLPATFQHAENVVPFSTSWTVKGLIPAAASPEQSPRANWSLLSENPVPFFTFAAFRLNTSRKTDSETSHVVNYGIGALNDHDYREMYPGLKSSARSNDLELNTWFGFEPNVTYRQLFSTLPTNAATFPGGASGLLPISKHGNLQTLDLWNPACGYTLVASAKAGTGGPLLTNELIVDTLSRNGKVVVWDSGSTRHLTKLLGGTYVDFEESSDYCLDLLSDIKSADDLDARLPVFFNFLSSICPEEPAIAQTLAGTVRDAWHSHYERFNSYTWLLTLESSKNHRVKMMGEYLREKLSPVSHWLLQGGVPVDWNNPFIVFSAAKLSAKPELKVLISASLALALRNVQSDPDTVRLLAFPETSEIFDHVLPATATLLRQTMQSTNTRAYVRVQSASDAQKPFLYDLAEHSSCRLFLGADSAHAYGHRQSPFNLQEGQLDTLAKLRNGSGFSEALLQVQGQWLGTTRLDLDPLTVEAYSTIASRPAYGPDEFRAFSKMWKK